jgi:hypothetical protein
MRDANVIGDLGHRRLDTALVPLEQHRLTLLHLLDVVVVLRLVVSELPEGSLISSHSAIGIGAEDGGADADEVAG